jgi:hypothetical protein
MTASTRRRLRFDEEKVSGLFFGSGRGGERALQQLHRPLGHGGGGKGVRTLFSSLAEEESAPSSSFTAHSGTAIRTPEGELALRGTRGYSIDHHARHGPEPPQKRVLTPFPRSAAIRELSCEVAAELEASGDPAWLWKGQYHAKLIDGFTFTMPDTPENQAEYPHPKSQQPGIGLPIARAVALISLATACVLNLKVGPYQGKETGETALLRAILSSLQKGDIAVMDRYYCSFMLLALLQAQGTHVCARKHHVRRQSDFRSGRRLGYHDHLVTWTRPQRPQWMSEELYQQIPLELTLRELRYTVTEKGRRTQTIEIITTLTDAEQYTSEDIAQLYGFRWNCELDLRSLKSNLNLGHLRCKTPQMIECELWTTILGYNLIRATAAGAALLHGRRPRQISFTCTCQLVLASWMLLSCQRNPDASDDFIPHVLEQLASCEVANRPGRIEPRVIKRRRQGYKLMLKPRDVLKAELLKKCT